MMKWTVFCIFCILAAGIFAQRSNYYAIEEEDDDDDDDDSCIPKLADDCFRFVSENLHCHFQPNISVSKDCDKKDAESLCRSLDEAIKCAQDIIDGDCTLSEGRGHFDRWINGLIKTTMNLCSNNMQLLKVVLQSPFCWNIGKFISCLENDKSILHVTDFLKQTPSLNNCYRLSIIMATCSTQASLLIRECNNPQNIIKELLHSFFSSGTCKDADNGQQDKKPIFKIMMTSLLALTVMK